MAKLIQPVWKRKGAHYDVDVNKGGLNVDKFANQCNKRFETDYRLAHVFEQRGNTVVIWERYDDMVTEEVEVP